MGQGAHLAAFDIAGGSILGLPLVDESRRELLHVVRSLVVPGIVWNGIEDLDPALDEGSASIRLLQM